MTNNPDPGSPGSHGETKFRIQDPHDLKTEQSLKIQDLQDITTK